MQPFRNRELLAGARFEPLAPAELPPALESSASPEDLIKCTQFAIPRCMAHIGQTAHRQLDPRKDFTYKSTTCFKRFEESSDGHAGGCLSGTRLAESDEDFSSEDDGGVEDNPPMTFTFTEFSPMCYAHVRSFFRVDSQSFGRVLRTSKWHSTPSPGKSSAHIFFCDKWVIKTMTSTESEFLRNILHRYYYHVRDNPSTFLPHFVGHYKVVLGMSSFHLIVMQNVFVTQLPIHRIYDLKGSTVGRFVSTRESQRTARMMKDLDLNSPIRIGVERKKMLMAQLVKDTDFLKKCMIMDYSLLVGIHEVHGSYSSLEKMAGMNESHPQHPEDWALAQAMGGGRAHELPMDDRLAGGLPSGRSGRPRGAEAAWHGVFTDDDGGMRSTANPGFPDEVYFAGIIDILQRYTVRKRMEHLVFGLRFDAEKISCVAPSDYADRFLSFISSITV